jgi:predicted nuclease with TOPRIM domain
MNMSSKKKSVSADTTALAPIKMVGTLVQNGLIADNNGAILYITSKRRYQLREHRAGCDKQIKEVVKKQEELFKQMIELGTKAAAESSKDWINSLNSAFKVTETALVASAKCENHDFNKKELVVIRTISTPAEEENHRGYGYEKFSKSVRIPMPAELLALQEKIKILTAHKSELEEIAVKIQRELHDLPNVAQDAQAAIFAHAMNSTAEGKSVMGAIDAKLDEMPAIPNLPALPAMPA